MDDTTILGGALNQLGQTAKQTIKQVVKMPEEMAQDAGSQISGEPAASAKGSGEPKQWQTDEERMKFLKDLYGKSDPSAISGQVGKDNLQAQRDEKPVDKSAEEQKKLLSLRNQLHKENYYDPTFNPVKKQEERPAEKVEMEKKQELQELEQKNAKKPPPIAVQREQNKAEMFRGAAG